MAENPFAKELGRQVVAVIAPEELPLFDDTWRVLGRRPARRSRQREEPLSVGLLESGETIVTAVASGVVSAVLADLSRDLGSRSTRLMSRVLRRAPRAQQPLPALPAQRLAGIRQTAFAEARKLGMSQAKANALADAVVTALVVEVPPS